MKIKKHIGKIANTDERIVVIFSQIPDDESSSLVVYSDSLPDMVHDALFRIVDSHEAESEVTLGNLLSRRPSPEPGVDMLTFLHRTQRLRKVPVTSVIMYPFPNQPFPLREIIEMNGGSLGEKKVVESTNSHVEKFNPHLDNQRLQKTQSMLEIATSKIREAELLEQEAQRKREEAYEYFPQLRPGYMASTTPSIESYESADVAAPVFDEPVIQEELISVTETASPKKARAKKAI